MAALLKFSKAKQSHGDLIQSLILAALCATMIGNFIQGIAQIKLSQMALTKDRWDMYISISVVTPEMIRDFHAMPLDYLDSMDEYESLYKNDDRRVREIIYAANRYEFLACLYDMSSCDFVSNLFSPRSAIDRKWAEKWTRDLVLQSDDFKRIHENFRGYYPLYEDYVDEVLRQVGR